MLKIVLKHDHENGTTVQDIFLDTGSRDVTIHRSDGVTFSLSEAGAELVATALFRNRYGSLPVRGIRAALETCEEELEAANKSKETIVRGLMALYLSDRITPEMVLNLITNAGATDQKTSE